MIESELYVKFVLKGRNVKEGKWLQRVLGFRPGCATLSRIASGIDKRRGKPQRRTRTVDHTGVPKAALTIDLDGFNLDVANIKWPVHVLAT